MSRTRSEPMSACCQTRSVTAPARSRPGFGVLQFTSASAPTARSAARSSSTAKDGQIIDIEGNYASPINGGTLCPKGAATFGLLTHPLPSRRSSTARPTPTTGRSARSTGRWSASPSWSSRRATRPSRSATSTAPRSTARSAIGHLGGATLDNEENYLIKKLFTAGLGIVAVENQARI